MGRKRRRSVAPVLDQVRVIPPVGVTPHPPQQGKRGALTQEHTPLPEEASVFMRQRQ